MVGVKEVFPATTGWCRCSLLYPLMPQILLEQDMVGLFLSFLMEITTATTSSVTILKQPLQHWLVMYCQQLSTVVTLEYGQLQLCYCNSCSKSFNRLTTFCKCRYCWTNRATIYHFRVKQLILLGQHMEVIWHLHSFGRCWRQYL